MWSQTHSAEDVLRVCPVVHVPQSDCVIGWATKECAWWQTSTSYPRNIWEHLWMRQKVLGGGLGKSIIWGWTVIITFGTLNNKSSPLFALWWYWSIPPIHNESESGLKHHIMGEEVCVIHFILVCCLPPGPRHKQHGRGQSAPSPPCWHPSHPTHTDCGHYIHSWASGWWGRR